MSDQPYQPLKGNATLLKSKALHYSRIADAITRSVTTLRKVDDTDAMKSDAIDALRGSAGNVADDIDKAQNRYRTTADALYDYAVVLQEAKDDAAAAIADIDSKQTAYDQAKHQEVLKGNAADDATDEDKATATTEAQTATTDRENAAKALTAAHDAWHAAVDKKNTAAKTAAGKIKDVVSGKHVNGLKDGWWDNWGSKVLDVIKVICEVAGFLAIFLSWVPILGQVLLVLAAIGAIITLIEAIVAAVNGEGSWTDVIFAAVGVVLTVFGGKIAAYLGKLAKFQTAQRFMTKGEDFLNSKAFKKLFNVAKVEFKTGDYRTLFKEGASFKGMLNDIKNPFSSSKPFTEWMKNPLGLQSIDAMGSTLFKAPWTAAKVAMVAFDIRKVESTGQTAWNFGDKYVWGDGGNQISAKPEQLLQHGSNAIEGAITGR